MGEFAYFESGRFYVGVNYWASGHGIYMWRDWDADNISDDFDRMAENGIKLVRMFPLWPDFQPLEISYAGQGRRHGYLMNGKALPDTELGQCGVEEVMLERLGFLLDCANDNGLKVMPGLVTGWMSGRMFAPPAFQERNVLTDPEVIKWEVRMVKCIVRRFAKHPAIVAWDLGNECNCMAQVSSEGEAWNWMNAISSAIRMEDSVHPVVSGMHGISCDAGRFWKPWDLGELNDILNTHPYPLFTPYSGLQRVNTMRNVFHATAESRMYADISGKPCNVEEAGNLGAMYSSQETASAYLNNMLWNAYAHDCRSLLWWCAFDFTHLDYPPYEWNAMERELGFFDKNKRPTQILKTLDCFQKTVDSLGFVLPRFRRNAICILTEGQETWGVAFASFILAKQAGFDIEFQYSAQPIRKADAYILPSVASDMAISRRRYNELLAYVKDGASLLMTWNYGVVQPFEEVFGCRPEWRRQGTAPCKVSLDGESIAFSQKHYLALSAQNSEVLANDEDGMPVMTSCRYGKGRAVFLSLGIEAGLAGGPDAFLPVAPPVWKFYSRFAEIAGIKRIVRSGDAFITCTEHFIDDGNAIVIAVNNTPEKREFSPQFSDGWSISETLAGTRGSIPGNSATMFKVTRLK